MSLGGKKETFVWPPSGLGSVVLDARVKIKQRKAKRERRLIVAALLAFLFSLYRAWPTRRARMLSLPVKS
jgi:hypothetical protein